MVYVITIDSGNFAPAKFNTLAVFLNILLPLATTLAAVIFLVMLLRATFIIITHGDNADALKKAQQAMTFAVLGLIITIFSFLLVNLIGKILGVTGILPL